MKVRTIQIYKTKESINKIINKICNYSFSDFKRTSHFEFSVMEKMTDIKLLEKTFPKFELIKSIELRENELKKKHYSFNYELENGTFVIIVLALDQEPPLLINGFHKNINYKRFEKSLRKYYKDKFI